MLTAVIGFSALSGVFFMLGAIYVSCFVVAVTYVLLLMRSSAIGGSVRGLRAKNLCT